MESSQTPSESFEDSSSRHETETGKLEPMVTSEQVLSAAAIRKRRNLSKKMTNKTREKTPCREIADKSTSDDNDDLVQKPKTPERKRRKPKKLTQNREDSKSKRSDIEGSDNPMIDKEKTPEPDLEKKQEIPRSGERTPVPKDELSRCLLTPYYGMEEKRKSDDSNRRNTLVGTTQAEILSLMDKAKKSLTPNKNKDRYKKPDKEKLKRSRSAPKTLEELQYSTNSFTELELINRLKKAHMVNEGSKTPPIRKSCSQDSPQPKDIPQLTSSEEEEGTKRKPPTPPVLKKPTKKASISEENFKKRKPRSIISPKVIEVLDPKTSKVVAKFSKGPPLPPFKLYDFFKILRYFTIRELFQEYRKFKREMSYEYDKIRNARRKCINDLLVIMIFCGVGGVTFKFIEGSFEQFYKCGVKRVKRDFIDLLWYRSHNLREEEWKSLARSKLRTFEDELHIAHEAGMHSYSGQRSWSFLNSVIYCLTIITTIGYGHITPQTVTGRALTIIYAIIGIPLFLIALTDFGKLFTRGIKFCWSFVRRIYYTGSCRRARKTAHVKEIFKGAQMVYEIATLRRPSMFVSGEDPENPKTADVQTATDTPTTPALSNFEIDDEFNLPISVAIFILILYIFSGAIIYWMWEGWDFFASFYFVFISMSTVGFGDFVPEHPVCMIVSIVYLCFGLALMSMCINVVQAKLSDTFKQASSKLGATIGIEVTDEDGSVTTVPPPTVEMPDVHQTVIEENGDVNKNKTNRQGEEMDEKNGDVKTTNNNQKCKKESSVSPSESNASETNGKTERKKRKKKK